MRGATGIFSYWLIFYHISIHAPARGATYGDPDYAEDGSVSIHAPARGATRPRSPEHRRRTVSIHAPARGATHVLIYQ